MWVMSYVNNMASAPSILCLRISPHISPFDRVWTIECWNEDKGLTSYYSYMLNWEELSLCEGRNVAVYEPHKIAVIAAPDIHF